MLSVLLSEIYRFTNKVFDVWDTTKHTLKVEPILVESWLNCTENKNIERGFSVVFRFGHNKKKRRSESK